MSAVAKRKATEELAGKPSKIIHSVLKDHSEALKTLSVNDFNYIRNNIYNERKKVNQYCLKVLLIQYKF